MEKKSIFKIKPEWTVDGQFEKYLQLVALDKRKMPPNQLREMRQMFHGATGQIIVLMRDELSALPDNQATLVLQEMLNEITNYFLPKG